MQRFHSRMEAVKKAEKLNKIANSYTVELPSARDPERRKPYKLVYHDCKVYFKYVYPDDLAAESAIAVNLFDLEFTHPGLIKFAKHMRVEFDDQPVTFHMRCYHFAHFVGAIKQIPVTSLTIAVRRNNKLYRAAFDRLFDPAPITQLSCGTVNGAYIDNAPMLIKFARANLGRLDRPRCSLNPSRHAPLTLHFSKQVTKVAYFPVLLELPGNWRFTAKSQAGVVSEAFGTYAAKAHRARCDWKYGAIWALQQACAALPNTLIQDIICEAVIADFSDRALGQMKARGRILKGLSEEFKQLKTQNKAGPPRCGTPSPAQSPTQSPAQSPTQSPKVVIRHRRM